MVSPAIVIIVMCIMEYGKLSISIDQYRITITGKYGDIVAWLDGLLFQGK